MIQRIQTLFLLAIAFLSAFMIVLPFQEVVANGQTHFLCLMPGCTSDMVKWFIYIPIVLNLAILVLSLVTMLGYKNRKRQMKLAQVVMVLSALLIGGLFTFHFVKPEYQEVVINYKAASFFPIINVVCAFFARHFIKKDEELVRSADRIR